MVAGELAYWLYEGSKHIHKSEYRYWAHKGLAGTVLRPSLCTRLGLPKDVESVVANLFMTKD